MEAPNVATEHRRSQSGEGWQNISDLSGGFIGIRRRSEISQHRKLASRGGLLHFNRGMSAMQDKDRWWQSSGSNCKNVASEQSAQDLTRMAQLFGVETGQQAIDIVSKRLWISCGVELKKL